MDMKKQLKIYSICVALLFFASCNWDNKSEGGGISGSGITRVDNIQESVPIDNMNAFRSPNELVSTYQDMMKAKIKAANAPQDTTNGGDNTGGIVENGDPVTGGTTSPTESGNTATGGEVKNTNAPATGANRSVDAVVSSVKELTADSTKDSVTNLTNTSAADSADASSASYRSAEYTTTNVQEEGVDESDNIKTDGSYMYIIAGQTVQIVKMQPTGKNTHVATIDLKEYLKEQMPKDVSSFWLDSIYLNNNKLAVMYHISNYHWFYDMGLKDDIAKDEADASAVREPAVAVDSGVETTSSRMMVDSFALNYSTEQTGVLIADVSVAEEPKILKSFLFEGNLSSSRLTNDKMHIVLESNFRNMLKPIPWNGTKEEIAAVEKENLQLIENATIEDILPTVTEIDYVSGKTIKKILVSANNLYHDQYTDKDLFNNNIVTIFTLNLKDPSIPYDSVGSIGRVDQIYASTDSIYLVTSVWNYQTQWITRSGVMVDSEDGVELKDGDKGEDKNKDKNKDKDKDDKNNGKKDGHKEKDDITTADVQTPEVVTIAATDPVIVDPDDPGSYNPGVYTIVRKFDIRDKAKMVASGTVWGHVLNSFSMGEYDSVFRIATNTGFAWGSGEQVNRNQVFLMKEDSNNLKIIGALENIAPGETIYSARFIGDKGFVVTFRQIDPLFTLDLSDPYEPKVAGELKVPGFSSYIHILDKDHLLTIGRDVKLQQSGDVTWERPEGILLSIFDVSDFAKPALLHKEIIGSIGAESEALYNPKAFNFWRKEGLLAIPVFLTGIEVTSETYASSKHEFTGLYVYDVNVDSGFKLRGKIETFAGFKIDAANGWWWIWDDGGSIPYWTRSIFVKGTDDVNDDIVDRAYTIAQTGYWRDGDFMKNGTLTKVISADLATMKVIDTLKLSDEQGSYPIQLPPVKEIITIKEIIGEDGQPVKVLVDESGKIIETDESGTVIEPSSSDVKPDDSGVNSIAVGEPNPNGDSSSSDIDTDKGDTNNPESDDNSSKTDDGETENSSENTGRETE